MKKFITAFMTLILALTLALGTAAVSADSTVVNIPDGAENVALDKDVEKGTDDGFTAVFFENAWFNCFNLTDGIIEDDVPEANVPTDMPLGWYVAASARDTGIYAIIDLDGDFDISAIIIYPMDFLKGKNMPSDFEILISGDGDDWVKVAEEKGFSEAAEPHTEPLAYVINQKASYVMFHITRTSLVSDGTYCYAGIDEIEVYGTEIKKTPKPTQEPTAAPTDAAEPTAAAGTPSEATAAADPSGEPAASSDAGNVNGDKTGNKNAVIGIVIGAVLLAAVIACIIIVKNKKKKK